MSVAVQHADLDVADEATRRRRLQMPKSRTAPPVAHDQRHAAIAASTRSSEAGPGNSKPRSCSSSSPAWCSVASACRSGRRKMPSPRRTTSADTSNSRGVPSGDATPVGSSNRSRARGTGGARARLRTAGMTRAERHDLAAPSVCVARSRASTSARPAPRRRALRRTASQLMCGCCGIARVEHVIPPSTVPAASTAHHAVPSLDAAGAGRSFQSGASAIGAPNSRSTSRASRAPRRRRRRGPSDRHRTRRTCVEFASATAGILTPEGSGPARARQPRVDDGAAST